MGYDDHMFMEQMIRQNKEIWMLVQTSGCCYQNQMSQC